MATVKHEAKRADFRVQVWAGPNATEGQRKALNRAVLHAVQETGVWFERVADSVRMTDDQQGESSLYWSVNNVKRVDAPEGETLVVEFASAQMFTMPNFHKKSSRVTRENGTVTAVAWDVDPVTTSVYKVGRNGVTAIRIERGHVRG